MKRISVLVMVLIVLFVNQTSYAWPKKVIENPMMTLVGHEDAVASLSFSPDGQRLASAGLYDLTVRIWDPETGREINVLKEHTNAVYSVAYDPTGRYLFSTSEDKTIKRWSVSHRKIVGTFTGHKAGVRGVAFNLIYSNLFASSGGLDNTVRTWNVDSGEELSVFGEEKIDQSDFEPWCAPISFFPYGNDVVVGYNDGTIKIWNIITGSYVSLLGHSNAIYAITISPDGQFIASGDRDGTVVVWNSNTNNVICNIELPGGCVFALAFSPDSKYLALGRQFSTVQICNVATMRTDGVTEEDVIELRGHTAAVYSLAFSPNGEKLASAASYSDSSIKIWDTALWSNSVYSHNTVLMIWGSIRQSVSK